MESIHNSTSENAEPSKGGIIEFEKSPQIEVIFSNKFDSNLVLPTVEKTINFCEI